MYARDSRPSWLEPQDQPTTYLSPQAAERASLRLYRRVRNHGNTRELESLTVTPEAFGQRLRALRHEAGISQATAAQAARVAPNTWWRYEQGVRIPPATAAGNIAAALGVGAGHIYAPSLELFIGELVLSPATLQELRTGGPEVTRNVALRLALALEPRLHAMAHPPLNEGTSRSKRSRRKRSRAEVYEQLAQAARRRADRAAAAELQDG